MKALVGAFNQEKALGGAFSVIVQPVVEPMDSFTALLWFQHFNSPLRCWPPGAGWHGDWWGAGGEAETSTPAADHTRLQHSLQHCRYSARTIGTDVYWISLVRYVCSSKIINTNQQIYFRDENWEKKMLIWQYFQRPQLFWLFLCIRMDWWNSLSICSDVYLNSPTSITDVITQCLDT